MSRYVSFGVLIAVILLLCIVFYRVMAAFLLPLFLATILVVVFRPIHRRVLVKTGYRRAIAAGITTTIISLAVIVPVSIVGIFAIGEARSVFRSLTSGGIEQNIKRIRRSLKLEVPAAEELHSLEFNVHSLDTRNLDDMVLLQRQIDAIDDASKALAKQLKYSPSLAKIELEEGYEPIGSERFLWAKFVQGIGRSRQARLKVSALVVASESQRVDPSTGPTEGSSGENKKSESENKSDESTVDGSKKAAEEQLADAEENRKQAYQDLRVELEGVVGGFDDFKTELLGGKLTTYLKDLANPTPEEFKKYNDGLINWIKTNFLSLGGKTTQFLFTLMFNGVIMMVAVYFFLVDGDKMIAAFKFLSPLDDRHEQELIDEFDKVSRAVVIATLATAAIQGFLAGLGYYFAGVDAVFLLTMLTTLLALVPFVGAGSVWVPTCLYLYLIEERLMPAVLLAIWGFAVVSTIDNFIKPIILHGQSNIHPLLALLSVLGGVSALGPIGILVGPMVVVFLQTLLKILQRELAELDGVRRRTEEPDDDSRPTSPDDESGDSLGPGTVITEFKVSEPVQPKTEIKDES